MKYFFIISIILLSVFQAFSQKANDGLAQVFKLKGVSPEVMARVAAANATRIKEGNIHYDKAINYMKYNDFDQAIRSFKEAERYYLNASLSRSGISSLYVNLAYCYMMQKDKGNSLKCLSRVGLKIKQDRDWVLMIGRIYENLREYSSAEIMYRKAIRLDKYYADSYNRLISLYRTKLLKIKKARVIEEKRDKHAFKA